LLDTAGRAIGKPRYSHVHFHGTCFDEHELPKLALRRARFERVPAHIQDEMHSSRKKPRLITPPPASPIFVISKDLPQKQKPLMTTFALAVSIDEWT
jgi:hypothetical protein